MEHTPWLSYLRCPGELKICRAGSNIAEKKTSGMAKVHTTCRNCDKPIEQQL